MLFIKKCIFFNHWKKYSQLRITEVGWPSLPHALYSGATETDEGRDKVCVGDRDRDKQRQRQRVIIA